MTTGAIIVAAGSSTRMGGGDKLLLPLAGRPLLAWSLACFEAHLGIDEVVVAASEANTEAIRPIAAAFPKARVVLGGRRRRDSVLRGLDALPGCDVVVVHDGARPLVTAELIDAALDGARATGAALCAVPVSDTVKRGGESGLATETVARDGLWLAQTPQAFRADLLRRAHAATEADATDDAALVELLGEPARLVEGSRTNLKVTTPEDVAVAEALLQARRPPTP